MAAIGRPREFDREAALDAAMRLFWRKGFATTSMHDLCAAMGIRSPSLYAAFGSKEALYMEAIRRYIGVVGPTIWDRLDEGDNARVGVRNMLHAAIDSLSKSDIVPGGCMAVLGGVSDEWPTAIVELIRDIRGQMLDRLRQRLARAAADGELPPGADAERLSRLFFSIFQGMAIQARDGAAAHDLRGVAEAAMAAWPEAGRA